MLNLAGHGASSKPRRNWRQRPHAKGRILWKTREASPTKEATKWVRPISDSICAPLWPSRLSDYLYPLANSHASTHSYFAAKEYKREGHHSREERVELVVEGFPNQRGNLARKTTSEFQELKERSR
jgi:hypothetical protein